MVNLGKDLSILLLLRDGLKANNPKKMPNWHKK